MHGTQRCRIAFCIFVIITFGLSTAGCHKGKGLTGENGTNLWILEMDAHPDTVAVGVNDTIFIEVRYGDEPQGGITVLFESNLGDPIPTITTVINDPEVPWGTSPMATFISREDTGVATLYGAAYQSEDEILARDTVTIWVVENP